jgi:hypothetical protein
MSSSGIAAPASRSFVALNGEEVKKAILADIANQLNADYHFRQHLSYALITWQWKMAVDVYPSEIKPFEVNAGATLSPKGAREIEVGEKPQEFDFVGSRDVTAGVAGGQSADSLRRETGQPIHQAKSIAGPGGERITVEAPVIPVEARESTSVRTERPSQTDVAGPKGIVARRAALKTKANPGGVEVNEKAGSAPTEADAEKIIEKGLEDGTLEERK